MVSFDTSDQAVAEEAINELERKGYLVWTSEDGGGHHVAEEYVRVSIL